MAITAYLMTPDTWIWLAVWGINFAGLFALCLDQRRHARATSRSRGSSLGLAFVLCALVGAVALNAAWDWRAATPDQQAAVSERAALSAGHARAIRQARATVQAGPGQPLHAWQARYLLSVSPLASAD